MMGATPAAELARLAIAYPEWRLSWCGLADDHVDDSCKAAERDGAGLLVASSPALLAQLLADVYLRRAAQDGRNSKGVGGNGHT